MVRILLILTIATLLAGCSAQKLAEKGQMDDAFEKAARQLERNPDRKAAVGTALAEAYTTLQTRDYQKVQQWYISTNPDRWEYAVSLLEKLSSRARRMDLIRLSATRIIRVRNFNEPDYSGELVVARREAAAALLAKAKDLMYYAEKGDRFAARDAFAALEKRRRYASDTAPVRTLKSRARVLGTLHVGLHATGDIGFADLRRVSSEAARQLSREWVSVLPVDAYETDTQLDLVVELDILRPQVSLPSMDRDREVFTRTVSEKVSIGVDTAGNEIFERKERDFRAVVITKYASQAASASGFLSVLDAQAGQLLFEDQFNGASLWEDWEVSIRGDAEALEGVKIEHKGARFGIRPTEFELASQALEALACAIPALNLDRIADQRRLASNY